MGDESGGGGGGAPKGASVRGQVGLTQAEKNARAVAQERGSRQSAGVAGPSSRGAAGARESGFASDASRAAETASDDFTTSTEGAYRDLSSRVTKGQISERVMNVLPGTSILNEMGKKVAGSIKSQIDAGGTPVYDTIGRIQGVVSKGQFGDVYTGGGVDPIANPSGTRLQKGIGYVQNERAAFGNYGPVGLGMKTGGGSGTIGGDSGDGGITSTQTASTATNVTGSTTSLSGAARRQALQGAAGGASRRQFIG
jgi:hypothetical protein